MKTDKKINGHLHRHLDRRTYKYFGEGPVAYLDKRAFDKKDICTLGVHGHRDIWAQGLTNIMAGQIEAFGQRDKRRFREKDIGAVWRKGQTVV